MTPFLRRACYAIVGAALTLAPPSSFAQASASVVELRTHCLAQRTPAMIEMFGVNYTPGQGNILDERLEQDLTASTPAQLAEAYQAFDRNGMSRHPAADRYAQCIYGERLRQLDPNANLQAVLQGDYTPPGSASAAASPWGAALTRRDANTAAGSAVLAQSADPAARAAHERENAALRQESERRIAQGRAERAAFWDTVLQAAAIAAQTYATVEAEQAQANASAQAETQAQVQAPSQQQAFNTAPSQQPTSPCVPGAIYGGGYCTGSQGPGDTPGGSNNCASKSGAVVHNGCNVPIVVAETYPPMAGNPQRSNTFFLSAGQSTTTSSQGRIIASCNYSMSPSHGARVTANGGAECY